MQRLPNIRYLYTPSGEGWEDCYLGGGGGREGEGEGGGHFKGVEWGLFPLYNECAVGGWDQNKT